MNWGLIGTLASVAAAGISLISNKADEEKMKAQVKKEVSEQLSKKEKQTEEA